MMFAIIATGGKQYLVREGMDLHIELLENKEGDKLSFKPLLVATDDGSTVKIGKPEVSGVTVSATVVSHGKEDKVSVIKYKPKSRYRRNVGHRQPFTQIHIEKINV